MTCFVILMFVTLYLEIQSGALKAVYLFIIIFTSYLYADSFEFWVTLIYQHLKIALVSVCFKGREREKWEVIDIRKTGIEYGHRGIQIMDMHRQLKRVMSPCVKYSRHINKKEAN